MFGRCPIPLVWLTKSLLPFVCGGLEGFRQSNVLYWQSQEPVESNYLTREVRGRALSSRTKRKG